MESGVAADLNQFLLYQEKWTGFNGTGHRTSIVDMLHTATPKSDNNPGIECSIDRVAAQMGMRRDETPDLHNRDVARRWIMAVAPNEGGTPDAGAVQRGVGLRLGPTAARPSATGAGLTGAPGATGRVDLNVKVQGDTPTVVTGKSTGGVDLYVAQPGLLFTQ